jgi:hypothetical protein
MAWSRMQSETERKPQLPIRGFLPFSEGATVSGELVALRLKEEGRGYALIRTEHELTVNVRDVESKTGQGQAIVGDIVGIRKTGATKRLWELPVGTKVRVIYLSLSEKTALNPKTKMMETNPYHEIAIDVWEDGY